MSRYGYFPPYVSVAERRQMAAREVQKLRKMGKTICPVVIEGRAIATSFWGRLWCQNLERYSDFSSRLPRGRLYVKNGSVADLQIESGRITALVSGGSLYQVEIKIVPVSEAVWANLKLEAAGKVSSLVELLQGRFPDHLMTAVTKQGTGLFPAPRDISLSCSCPDYANMCKHVAATLYGVGARLDQSPELLFRLRNVDHLELLSCVSDRNTTVFNANAETDIGHEYLSDLFGIEMDGEDPEPKLVEIKKNSRPKGKAKKNRPQKKRKNRLVGKKNAAKTRA